MLYQANRVLTHRLLITYIGSNKYSEKFFSTKILYPLEHRKLIKVCGNDASMFLQGLITNDMKHFDAGAKSIYAIFLNNKGRVLYDTLIHKWQEDNSFAIECDDKICELLKRHLNLFKLRRLVKIDVNNDYKVWSLISPELQETNVCTSNLSIYKDPRLVDLGFRIIADSSQNGLQIAEIIGKDIAVEKDSIGYKYLRYKLGVSEGAEDLPPGSTFPLEVNCDYLHGVSFHKGCYIGQELTARVHHTGVVRKRIMPLKFSEELKENVEIDTIMSATNNPKSNLGKLKGFVHDYGIGLVRIKEALDAKVLKVGKYSAEILKPTWWPIEAPKDKTNIKIE